MLTYFLTEVDKNKEPLSLLDVDGPVLVMREFGDVVEFHHTNGRVFSFNLREQGYQLRKIT